MKVGDDAKCVRHCMRKIVTNAPTKVGYAVQWSAIDTIFYLPRYLTHYVTSKKDSMEVKGV